MEHNKDTGIAGMMAAALIVIIAVITVIIVGFLFLHRRHEGAKADSRTTSYKYEVSAEGLSEEADEDIAGGSTAVMEEADELNEESAEVAESPKEEGGEDIYLVMGEENKSNKYEKVDKLTYTDSVRYTYDELKLLDRSGLRITRNEIFARHGRMFNDQELQKYFDDQPWYKPKYTPADFDETCLNDIELYNVNLIVSYEQEQGYQ